ncbi:MAG: nuclear transport factor 2 family protein [Gammaproteobacteria bacterium]
MKSGGLSRRGVLNGTVALAAGVVAGVARPSTSVAATNACGGLSREEYLEYVTLFNANDPRFLSYYHDDVVFELGTTVIKGAAGIRDFYAPVKAHIHEKVEVVAFLSNATAIAAELPTEFRVYKDWENGYFQRPLKAGEVMRTISFGFYEVEDRKFRRIRAARYKQIHDWRMEPA